jgi:hypothetical protein
MALLTLGLILCAGRRDSNDGGGSSLRGSTFEPRAQKVENKAEIPSVKNDFVKSNDEDGHQQLPSGSSSSSQSDDGRLFADDLSDETEEDVGEDESDHSAFEEADIDHGDSDGSSDDDEGLGLDRDEERDDGDDHEREDEASTSRSEDLDDADDESREEEGDDVESSQDGSAPEIGGLPERSRSDVSGATELETAKIPIPSSMEEEHASDSSHDVDREISTEAGGDNGVIVEGSQEIFNEAETLEAEEEGGH